MSVSIWNATEQKLEQVGGNVNINDSVISENSTFSSKMITDFVPFKLGITDDGQYGYIKDGADTVTPFKSGGDIQYYRCVENIGPSKSVTKTFSEIGFVPKIVMCMNGDSAIMRYVDGSFSIAVGSGLVVLNNLTTWNVFQVTEEEIKMSIKWHGDTQSYNIVFLG